MIQENETLALQLFDRGIFKREALPLFGLPGNLTLEFNLHSSSDPLRPGPVDQELLHQCGRQLFKLVEKLQLEYRYVAGVPHTGTALAQAFLRAAGDHQLALQQLTMIKDEETGQIDFAGDFLAVGSRPGASPKLLLVDDRLITGVTIRKAIAAAEERGFAVTGVAVLLDLEADGLKLLRQDGYDAAAIFTLRELVEIYRRSRKISFEEGETILGLKS